VRGLMDFIAILAGNAGAIAAIVAVLFFAAMTGGGTDEAAARLAVIGAAIGSLAWAMLMLWALAAIWRLLDDRLPKPDAPKPPPIRAVAQLADEIDEDDARVEAWIKRPSPPRQPRD